MKHSHLGRVQYRNSSIEPTENFNQVYSLKSLLGFSAKIIICLNLSL
ncbi:hypothetical protein PL921480145 [Planktothrix tepida PCC 9214]|uniref:Uncharacterized protein n=1 Tax=Planktothrix tepida PCC 9214 TaxID=671072 RepID=A0A1J1LTV5_9CYAN|nr:hypothetical protein PL921480145 [Planktothrix tepida PCC 9214]